MTQSIWIPIDEIWQHIRSTHIPCDIIFDSRGSPFHPIGSKRILQAILVDFDFEKYIYRLSAAQDTDIIDHVGRRY